MLQWKIGDVSVKRIVEMEVPVKYHPKYAFLPKATPEALKTMPWLYPHFVSDDGALVLSIHALLVEAPGLRLVVDTCVGNDKPRGLTGNLPLSTPFLQHMADAGWNRESVDAVVCTHLHVDHVGWNTMKDGDKWVPTFPNARYLIGKTEYEHWSKEGDNDQQTILSDSVKPVFDAGLVQLVDMNHRVSPEVRLMPTTGHTPGHVSVVIEFEGRDRRDHRRHGASPLPVHPPGLAGQFRQRRGRRRSHAPRFRKGLRGSPGPRHRYPLRRADGRTHPQGRRHLQVHSLGEEARISL